ncbi:chaperone modulator CbpM [Ochrobactrum soli]|uniref:Transcriptional regulator, MerR family n=1 Tax=Ochrobactrum soli TaxID=2448455 RepID=A0A2P9HEZ0_9HYPH|nr:hypothetical protein OHAE_5275 [[Ochrobactrum] soli]
MSMMTKREFLATSGLKGGTLEIWLRQEWIIPKRTAEGAVTFSDADIARARLIKELKKDFGANDAGVDVILHLLDQLHGMRRSLELLRVTLVEDRAKHGE